MIKETIGRRVYLRVNAVLLLLVAAICLIPILHVIALSFSSSSAVMAGRVTLWPIQPTLASYNILMQRSDFFDSFRMSLYRVVLGMIVNLALIVMTAYPLSKQKAQFHGRTIYAWYMIITIIFSGGLIPTYMVCKTDRTCKFNMGVDIAGRRAGMEHRVDDEFLPQPAA